MNVSEAIRLKRAVRQFTDQPLPDASIRTILNVVAGRNPPRTHSRGISLS